MKPVVRLKTRRGEKGQQGRRVNRLKIIKTGAGI